MKLKTLRLHNIRSYEDQEIDFRDGITLFEGDIGSGKSSILHSIEFALFGLGNLRGTHLLRVGEREGKVELDLRVNELPYTFGRTLIRKRSTVGQDTGYIIENDTRTEYNATEMKRRALQILNFREPTNPRSHSVIYRYAIFTPQEQMREVIRQKADRRKETLRKAFGVEEYSIAAGNAGIISRGLQSVITALERSQKEIERVDKEFVKAEQLRDKTKEEQSNAKSELIDLNSEISTLNAQITEKKKEEEELNQLSTEIELLNQLVAQKNREIQEAGENLEAAHKKIQTASEAEEKVKELKPDYETLLKLRSEIQGLEKKYTAYTEAQREKGLLVSDIDGEREKYQELIRRAGEQLESVESEITDLEETVEQISPLENQAKQLQEETARIGELNSNLTETVRVISSFTQQSKRLDTEKSSKQDEWAEVESLEIGALCPQCQQELTQKHYGILKEKYQTEINQLEKSIKEIAPKIEHNKIIENKTREELEELEKTQRTLNELNLQLKGLKTQLEGLEPKKEEAKRISSEVSDFESKLKDDFFAKAKLEKIEEFDETIRTLQPHVALYEISKAQIQEYEKKQLEKKYIEAKNTADRKTEYLEEEKGLKLRISTLEEETQQKREELDHNKNIYEENKTVIEELKTLREQLEKKRKREGELNNINTRSETEITRIDKEIQGLRTQLKEYREDLEKAEIYRIIRRWLDEALIPSFSSIEKNVLLTLNQEFNSLFQRWFENLIESGELNGYIDEDFTPMVEQGGYELEVESLSGGEKTSVALAYRLALNTIVKRVTDTMKSNLLILDEPTDGFSRDQLYKMREILHDLNCEQIIMVSHETELESVADHIYRVSKQGTTSTVASPL